MPEFYNPNPYTVHLTGPNGETVQVRGKARVNLPEFYDKYCQRRYIKRVAPGSVTAQKLDKPVQPGAIQGKVSVSRTIQRKVTSTPQAQPASVERLAKREIIRARKNAASKAAAIVKRQPKYVPTRLVGRAINTNPNELLRNNLAANHYPISNNIGVGILSFNRRHCLERLIQSIIKTTDLRKTTVFISDDGSTDADTIKYLDELAQNSNFVVLRNKTRIGVAGNTNRLLRCLSRFAYGLLLNDDVEVKQTGWEYFYQEATQKTLVEHFAYREDGVYNADRGEIVAINGVDLWKVTDRPHGAVLAFTNSLFNKIGYFDESYGMYGMEHVDWSSKAFELGQQPNGFFDVNGSEQYFKIHTDKSAVYDKAEALQAARAKFAKRIALKCGPSEASAVPSISYVIPFRNFERAEAIRTVVNNVRAQRYPVIDIIMSEQDVKSNIDVSTFMPVNYILVQNPKSALFNKSKAFNAAVAKAKAESVILHDADMLAQGHYTKAIADILETHEACHIGNTVIYSSQSAAHVINESGIVDENVKCDRTVGYYEGGSLACRTSTYWRIGGFNEDYDGYGCFSGDTPVLLADGTLKPISEVEEGNIVISNSGIASPVTQIFSRRYVGTAYQLRIEGSGHKPTMTADHPILVFKNDEFEWVEAANINIGDLIAVKWNHNDINDVESIDVIDELSAIGQFTIRDGLVFPTRIALGNENVIDGSAIGLFPFLAVNDDLLDLIGYYAAEGCASPKNGIRFSVCDDEFAPGDIGAEICGILTRLGLKFRINKRGNGRGRDIQTFCKPLGTLLRKWFPATKNDKMFPNWVMQLPPAKQLRILAALIRGDGYLDFGRQRIRLRMGNKKLISQAMFLAARCGGTPYYYYNKPKNGFDTYEMAMGFKRTPPGLGRLLNFVGSSVAPRCGYIISPVKEITLLEYDDIVYNIEVAGDHSYIVGGVCVKNCEDCDFYARLAGGSNWKEDRVFDFLHLWHSRVGGWNDHHENNKRLERDLKQKPIELRIHMQHIQLERLGYGAYLVEAMKSH